VPPQPNIGVYGNGLFQDTTPPYDQQLAQMRASAFTTVVLWALHVHEGGDFYFNDNLAVRDGQLMWDPDPAKKMLNPDLPKLLSAVRASGVERVGFSIGPFVSDFEAIAANMHVATINFKSLITALSIDFIDFDYEGSYSAGDRGMLIQIASLVDTCGAGVSFCPYEMEDWWLGCLAELYSRLGRQPVRYMNLQCYDGGDGNDPAEWVDAIKRYPKPLGITDPDAFVLPGYWVMQNYPDKEQYGRCPSQLDDIFRGLKPKGTQGGWLWNSGDIFAFEDKGLCPGQDVTPKGYSQAVLHGLEG
jgi:hypothetical protein